MKWMLPDVSIAGGGYLIVFSSGRDRRNPEEELDTNVSLSSGGEYLGLIAADGSSPTSQFSPVYPRRFDGVAFGTGTNVISKPRIFVPWPSSGTWIAPVADIGDFWQEVGFDDGGWNFAQTGIGYGYSFPGFIGAGGDARDAMQGKAGSAHVRALFQIDDPAEVVSMTLDLFDEDGCAAYLNGELVSSANLHTDLSDDSVATNRGEVREGDEMESFEIDLSGKLLSGENLLVFQVLNDNNVSSDVLLVLRLKGEVRDLSGGIIGGYLASFTPGTPNADIEFVDSVSDTIFDVDRGFLSRHSSPRSDAERREPSLFIRRMGARRRSRTAPSAGFGSRFGHLASGEY